MTDGNTNSARGKIVIIFSILGVIIVGLIIAIIVVVLLPKERYAAISKDANTDCLKVQNDYNSVDGYPYEELMELYENVLSEHDKTYNVNYSVCYANFLYSTYNDIEAAIDVMGDSEKFIDDDTDDLTKIGFYSSSQYFYKIYGDKEMANYYADLIKSLSANESMEVEE